MSAAETAARAALAEITPAETVGELLGTATKEDGVLTLSFAAVLSGYPGWHWSVSVAQLPDAEPTVLEAELMPGEGALLAPDWVPWAERLEEYRAAQAAAAEASGEADEESDEGEGDEFGDADEFGAEDDFGIDPDDGIDFESGLAAVGVDEEDEAEADADEGGPEPAEPSGLLEDSEQD